ncbi:MAG: SMC-Scp complex subunit ScpB [Candidatus Methanodesulfokora sp.]|jgi:segregation and condensation protein B|nr:MAG: SMC-Scp complex subunit ScpB [Candidatus Korarchaeota archaeon]
MTHSERYTSRSQQWDRAKRLLEALIFSSPKPVSEEEIKRASGLVGIAIEKAVDEINSELSDHPFEIVRTGEGWEMRLKDEYMKIFYRLVEPELSKAELKTLAIIAAKGETSVSEVLRLRGGAASNHIKKLIRMGLIKREKRGRRTILSVTEKFNKYFMLDKTG